MTDWSKLKVADLKDELKARGVPLTGLKLKQQFVEKLEELDRGVQVAVGVSGHEEASENTTQEDTESPFQIKPEELSTTDDAPTIQSPRAAGEKHADAPAVELRPSATSAGAELLELVNSYSSAPRPTPSQTLDNLLKDQQKTAVIESSTQDRRTIAFGDFSANPSETFPPLTTSAPSTTSTPIPAGELVEDSKKRKRRSVTPPPSAEDVSLKKAKARDGKPFITKQESSALKQVQEATNAAEDLRDSDGVDGDILLNDTKVGAIDFTATTSTAEIGPSFSAYELTGDERAPLRSSSPKITKCESPATAEQNRAVTSALHPATRSLYMRNFKRPLHIPTLRNLIADLAQPPSTSSDDIIASFYLDNIRSHAFISFKSISAASRVRTSMHDTVFPDEATRIPIWIDFVPDDRLQSWIDKENVNGGDRNRKWEVIYNVGHDGVEVVHKEVGAALPSEKGNAQQRQASTSEARSRPTPSAPSIHPDRASMVPQEERSSYHGPSSSRTDTKPTTTSSAHLGRGFKALDELFSSTTAKPKLYYKAVSANVADSRLNKIKYLRVGHSEMGKSGDAGMLRYTFEGYNGQEEWVEKGPEFGYGRKGVERLAGRGGRGIGFRGGRRFEGGRGGELWRGRN